LCTCSRLERVLKILVSGLGLPILVHHLDDEISKQPQQWGKVASKLQQETRTKKVGMSARMSANRNAEHVRGK
jgi:hypothetical protein